jgi:glycosyltransferase involved in cell wall biosynthesis
MIVYVTENLDDTYGGPSVTIPMYLEKYLAINENLKVLIDLKCGEECNNKLLYKLIPNKFTKYNSHSFLGLNIPYRVVYAFLKITKLKKVEVLHLNTIWRFGPYVLMLLAIIKNIPVVISPRGMLIHNAVKYKYVLKTIIWNVCYVPFIRSIKCFHTTSVNEAVDLKKMGSKATIAIVKHGIEPYKYINQSVKKNSIENLKLSIDFKYILFISRIVEHKGLHILISAYAKILSTIENYKIIVAGCFNDVNYEQYIKSLISKYKIEKRVIFLGHVSEKDKMDVFSAASLFVLPTKSESFGAVIGEAISYGLPVITTRATPWIEITETKVGVLIERDINSFAKQISYYCKLNKEKLNEMQPLYKRIVSRYSWDKSANKINLIYKWCTGKSNKPKFVFK